MNNHYNTTKANKMESFNEFKYVIKINFKNRVCYYNGGNYCMVSNPYFSSRYKTTEDKNKNIDYIKSNVDAEVEFALFDEEYQNYLRDHKNT